MPVVRVSDHQFTGEWDGQLIASVRTVVNPLRWVEIELYKLTDGGWLVHRVGRSKVYHRGDTLCRTARGVEPGELVTPRVLPAGADPCPICEPPYPERLQPGEQIRWEVPKHRVDRCRTPEQVIRKLTQYRDGASGVTVTSASGPVQQLLKEAAEKEPAFAQAMLPGESIRLPVSTGNSDD